MSVNVHGSDNTVITRNAGATVEAGKNLSRSLKAGDIIALVGELGAGKTVFTRGICRGLGIEVNVLSPTFVLLHEYNGRLPVFHFDFYRLSSEEELAGIGFYEYLQSDGVTIIEWADRLEKALPVDSIWIHLAPVGEDENARAISFMGRRESTN